jgi:hypothetical protein
MSSRSQSGRISIAGAISGSGTVLMTRSKASSLTFQASPLRTTLVTGVPRRIESCSVLAMPSVSAWKPPSRGNQKIA